MYADASGVAQTFQYDTAALQQLGASMAPLAPQPGAVGASLTWTQDQKYVYHLLVIKLQF